MDNSVCHVELIVNPNRRYANTVNLVFFRAYPLYKNFKVYVEGLKNWKEYKKSYPDSQIQIFVDKSIAEDESIMKTINELDARVYVVSCQDYQVENKYHIGLFPTLWRFFPCFDINKHAFKVAHIQELEPDKNDVVWFKYLNAIGNMKYDNLGLVYRGSDFYTASKLTQKFEKDVYYPQIFAGRFLVRHQAPFKLMTDFLDSVKQGDKILKLSLIHI